MRRLLVADLVENVSDHLGTLIRVKLFRHSPESYAHYVAVMQFRPRILFGQFEPHLVQQIQILRPQSRPVRAEVDED